jgi:hypothetical protein
VGNLSRCQEHPILSRVESAPVPQTPESALIPLRETRLCVHHCGFLV